MRHFNYIALNLLFLSFDLSNGVGLVFINFSFIKDLLNITEEAKTCLI